MSEDFLKNPLSLFDIRGKTAIVTGASGAFGALAAKVLAGAGGNLVLAAGGPERLEEGRGRMRGARRQGRDRRHAAELGGQLREDRRRPRSKLRPRRHSGGRLRPQQGRQDRRPEARGFLDVMDANVTQSWLMARAAGKQMLKQGRGGKVDPHVVGARAARPSGRLHRLLRLEVGGRRHHQGARLRMGRHRHHRQRASARPCSARRSPPGCTRTPSARTTVRKGFLARVPKGRLGEPADLAGPAAVPRLARRRTSTPAISSTPTAAIRRAEPWRQSPHRGDRRRPDGPRHRPGVRARRP